MKPAFYALGLIVLTAGCSGSEAKLVGAGSTFVQPLMEKWADEFAAQKKGTVYYESLGSGIGLQRFASRVTDFACTEAPLPEQELDAARQQGDEVYHIPLVLGAVVPAYNLDGMTTPLTFSGPVLADIYLGKITDWNDKALQELNPGAKLPAKPIVVLHRSEPSGTTYIWSEFLSKLSPEWKKKVGVGTSPNWSVGTGYLGNEGVASAIKETPGSLGYVSLTYALRKGLTPGLVKNAEGEAIAASLDSVHAAAAALKEIPDDLRLSITNAPGKGVYPLSGVVWAVVHGQQQASKRKDLAAFLRWTTHDGQGFVEALHYARLPANLVGRIDARLDQFAAGK
jgi:phosphate transport system substrate-binding protein